MSTFSYPENQSDELFIEVLDVNMGNQGKATIHLSSIADGHVCSLFLNF